MIAALLLKEVQQHAAALAGACALVAIGMICGLVIGLEQAWPTLLAVAHGMAYGGLPLLVLFVDGRLVVHDHQAGTHEFLAALPISPWLRTTVRFLVGLAVVWSVAGATLLANALFALGNEGVPLGFLAQLAAQIGLYLLAWHGVAFGIAHTGRYRFLLWWLLFVSLPMAEALTDRPLSSVYWFGLMTDGADRARMLPPWDAIPLALAWAALGTALGFGISVWRGGVLLERAFRPATADQRARMIGVGIAAMLATGAFGDLAPPRDEWEALPAASAERATVRVAASPGAPLWRVGEQVARELDALGQTLDVARWPPIVLLRARPRPGAPPVALAPGVHATARVLLVDPGHPREELVQGVVSEVLAHRLAGLVDWDPDGRLLVDGLGAWWVGAASDRQRQLAALGVGRSEAALADWHVVRRELGPEVAVAVARAGLVALEAQRGRDAVLHLARVVLGPERRAAWPSGCSLRRDTRPGWVERVTGIERAAWLDAWERELATVPPPAVGRVPPLSVEVRDGEAVIAWDGPAPAGAVIEWTTLDPLQDGPLPEARTEFVEPPPAAREIAVRADARLKVAARWVTDPPSLGRLSGPWTARR